MTRICLVTTVKNEGPFILEWLAHYRALGVDRFLIFSNDCDDGTDALLDRLDDLGVVRHLPNPSGAARERMHHRMALAYAPYHKEFRQSDYVLILDVDEFVQVRLGDGTLQGLLAALDMPDVLSMSELVYGFGGVVAFEDRPVTEQFLVAMDTTPGPRRARRGVKSLVRVGQYVQVYSNHRPAIRPAKLKKVRWLDGAGRPVDPEFAAGDDRGLDTRDTYVHAWVNHYTLRSAESMLVKFERGDAVRDDRMKEAYFRRRDATRETNACALQSLDAIRAGMADLMADAEVKRLHEACVESHRARIPGLKEELPEIWEGILRQLEASAARIPEMPVNTL